MGSRIHVDTACPSLFILSAKVTEHRTASSLSATVIFLFFNACDGTLPFSEFHYIRFSLHH